MIQVLQLGRIAYAEALELQRALVERRKAGAIADTLLLLEHPAVITLGRNAHAENIVASREALAARGVEVFECDRGGDVTWHGPGQLVGYPIFDLRGFTGERGERRTLWPVEFVRKLEEALILACEELGVPCGRIEGLTGVWTRAADSDNDSDRQAASQAKIAAIGVHISRGVTSHGFALNVNADLEAFKLIVPCGINDRPVTSLQRELAASGRLAPGAELDMEKVSKRVAESFGRVFHQELKWLVSADELLPPAPQDTPVTLPRELKQVRGEDEVFLA